MKWHEYQSDYMLCVQKWKENYPGLRMAFPKLPTVDDLWQSQYDLIKRNNLGPLALVGGYADVEWHKAKRPYFRVYPTIERKLIEIGRNSKPMNLRMPFKQLEVSTQSRCFLLFRHETQCFVASTKNGKRSISHFLAIGDWAKKDDIGDPSGVFTKQELVEQAALALGVSLLANDPRIIAPVILNEHRRENMTPEDIERRAAQAVSRTGRVGFDVGRDIERLPVTAHYRNGCFALYYVGREHKQYPQAGTADREPVLIWRAGAVVNADRLPKVPTGFRDQQEARE